jgi:general secretion pathway protein G
MEVKASLQQPSLLQRRRGDLRRPPCRSGGAAGFTLIELMIVVSIILILIGVAAMKYDRVIQHSKEAVLKTDLRTIRDAIDNYTLDKQAAPQSVDDLQQAGYLRAVPVDPMTQAKDWVPQFDSVVLSPEQTTTGMVDAHSNSNKVSPFDGTPYNEW